MLKPGALIIPNRLINLVELGHASFQIGPVHLARIMHQA